MTFLYIRKQQKDTHAYEVQEKVRNVISTWNTTRKNVRQIIGILLYCTEV